MNKLDQLIMKVRKAFADKFTGSLRINFFQGGITNLNWEFSEKLD